MPSTFRDIVVNLIMVALLIAALTIILMAAKGIAYGSETPSHFPELVYVYDLHPSREPVAELVGVGEPYIRAVRIHLHCDNEINGGGYRNGKYVYAEKGSAK